jgi:hypothetical protein
MKKSVHQPFGGGRARSKRRKTLKRKNPKRKTPKRKTPKRKNQKKRRSSRKAGAARMFKCLEPDPGQAKRDAAEKKAKDDREQWKKDIKEAIAYNKSQAKKRARKANERALDRWDAVASLNSSDYAKYPDEPIPGAYYPRGKKVYACIPSGWDWRWWWVPDDEKERLTRIAYEELYGDAVDVEYPPEKFKDVRDTQAGDWLIYPGETIKLRPNVRRLDYEPVNHPMRLPSNDDLVLNQGALERRYIPVTAAPNYGNLTTDMLDLSGAALIEEMGKRMEEEEEGMGTEPGTGTITSEPAPAPEPSSE